jgi:uncharacterized protein
MSAERSPGAKAVYYSDGQRVSATLQFPPGGTSLRRHPAIILCPGLASVKEMHFAGIASALNSKGYATMAIDYRGFGESEGRRGVLIPMGHVDDIINAVTYLSIRDDVEPGRIGVLGSSFGGAVAIVAAALDQRIRALVASVTIGDCERWLRGQRSWWQWKELLRRMDADRRSRVVSGRAGSIDISNLMNVDPTWAETVDLKGRLEKYPTWSPKISMESLEHILAFKPEQYVHLISPRGVLLVAASEDNLVPPDEIRRIYAKAGDPKKLVVLDGAHYEIYSPPLLQDYMRQVEDWVAEHI